MFKKLLIPVLVGLIAYLWIRFRAVPGITVATVSGDVQGIITESRDGVPVYEWRGIPYAKPPVAELRFQSPQPYGKWNGVRKAHSYGSACIHYDMMLGIRVGSEDCLFLNVYVPQAKFLEAKQTGKKLPVVVFFHGGGFMILSGDNFTPEYFMDEGVVFVSMNYRLGIFGFLSAENELVKGNMGLKDQALSLRWVKENIANFGGDPDKITIMGESAGAASAHYHLLYPKNKDIVKGAILFSGTVFDPWSRTDTPLENAKLFAKRMGCPSEPTEEMITCFRTKDAYELVLGHAGITNVERSKNEMFVPVVEKTLDAEAFLTEDPNTLYSTGKVLNVPIMVGVTRDEGLFVTAYVFRNTTFRRRLAEDITRFSPSLMLGSRDDKKKMDGAALRKFYLGHNNGFDPLEQSTFEALTRMGSDRMFWNGMRKATNLHSKVAPVYPFIYAKEGPSLTDVIIDFTGERHVFIELFFHLVKRVWHYFVPPQEKKHYGVCHGDDMVMYVGAVNTFFIPKGDPHYEFSKAFVRTLASFAKGEEPQFLTTSFPKVTAKSAEKYIYIDDAPKIVDYPYSEAYEFWKKLGVSW